MKRNIPLSALRDVAVLFPKDLHDLGAFMLKAFDARDREFNSRNTGTIVGRTRPTPHGLAGRYALVTDVSRERIENLLVAAGFDLGAIVELDTADSGHDKASSGN